MDLARRVLDLAEEYLVRPVQRAGQVALLGISLAGCGDTIVNQYYGDGDAGEERAPHPNVGQPTIPERIAFVLKEEMSGATKDVYVISPDGTNMQRLAGSSATETAAQWIGRRQVLWLSIQEDGNHYLFQDVETGQETDLTADRTLSFTSGMVSPSGEFLAATGTLNDEGQLYLLRTDGTGRQQITNALGNSYYPRAWSSDSAFLAYVISPKDGSASNIYVLDVQRGTSRNVTNGSSFANAPLTSSAWRPNHNQLLAATDGTPEEYGRGLYLFDIDSGTIEALLRSEDQEYSSPRWLPGGNIAVEVAPRGGSSSISLVNADTGQQQQLAPGRNFSSSPDGQKLVYTARTTDTGEHQLFIVSLEGETIQLTSGDYDYVTDPVWSP